MSASTSSTFTVSDDSDIKTYVRALTNYSDSKQELPDQQLKVQIALGKQRLQTKYGVSEDTYSSDDSLAQALIYGVAIYCKGTVENYSVGSWDFGDEGIEARDVPPEDSVQLNQWSVVVEDSLSDSPNTDAMGGLPRSTFAPDFSH